MATNDKSTESVYRVTEVIGTSAQSWEDAAKSAVQTAAGTLRDLRIAEVVKWMSKLRTAKSSSTGRVYNCPSSTKASPGEQGRGRSRIQSDHRA